MKAFVKVLTWKFYEKLRNNGKMQRHKQCVESYRRKICCSKLKQAPG